MSNIADIKKVCLGYVRDPQTVLNFAKEEGKDFDEQLRAKFLEVLGVEKFNKKVLRRNSTKELVFEIIAEVIEEAFVKGVEEDEFFMQFAEIKYLARGDKNEFIMDEEAVLVVSEHAGNNWNIRRQKFEGGKKFSVDTKAYAVGVYGDFEEFMTGRKTLQKFIDAAVKGLKRKLYEIVAASFADAITALPNAFKQTGTYAQDKLITLYDHVDAASNRKPVILGAKKAIGNIGSDVTWYSDKMKDTRNENGHIGTFLGMDLAQLPVTHKAGTFDFAYADDILYVLPADGTKFISITIEGDDLIKATEDQTENIDMNYEYKHITRMGAAVKFSEAFGVYEF